MISGNDVGSAWKNIPWNLVFEKKIVADRIFLRSALIRKDLLPQFVGKHMPKTYDEDGRVLNEDGVAYDKNGWVEKPCDSSNAVGVSFVPSRPKARSGYIAQHCIPSRLIEGKKFHLRCLLLLVGDLDGYVYDDCRVLVAPVKSDVDSDHARITNRSFNLEHEDYDETVHNISLSAGNHGLDPKTVSRQIRDVCADVCRALADHADDRSAKRRFFALENTWEMFGLDFAVDDAGRLLLLEANPEPSMKMWPSSILTRGSYCPVTMKGLPRSNEERVGWSKVYSKRIFRALQARRKAAASSLEKISASED